MALEALNALLEDEKGGVFFLPEHAQPKDVAAVWVTSMRVPRDCSAGQSRCGLMSSTAAHSHSATK